MTSLYHFLFVPLTLGLAPLVAVMQTLWYRVRRRGVAAADPLLRDADADQLRDRRRDRARAGVPVRDELVGLLGVRRRRLRCAARDRGARRVHARVDVPRPLDLRLGSALAARAPRDASGSFALGTWLSAFFIIVANSWMQRPVGSDVVDGRAELTSIWDLLTNRLALWAYGHVVVGRHHDGRCRDLRRLVLAHPPRPERGSLPQGGEARADRRRPDLGDQSLVGEPPRHRHHRLPADEDRRRPRRSGTPCQPCGFSLFQIGGFTERGPDAELRHRDPEAALVPRDRLLQRRGAGHQPAPVSSTSASTARAELQAASRDDVLGDAGHGLPRQPRLPRARRRRASVVAQAVRDEQVVPVGRCLHDSAAVPGGARRLGADGGRATAVDRLGAAQDRRCELSERLEHARSG